MRTMKKMPERSELVRARLERTTHEEIARKHSVSKRTVASWYKRYNITTEEINKQRHNKIQKYRREGCTLPEAAARCNISVRWATNILAQNFGYRG